MEDIWTAPAATDVLQEFTPMEKATLNAIQQAATQLPAVLANIVEIARKAYRDGGREVSAVAGTIPAGEFSRVIAWARWKWLVSFPQLKTLQTDGRKQAAADAETYFTEIAKRELPGSGGAEIVSQCTRRFTRQQLDGI